MAGKINVVLCTLRQFTNRGSVSMITGGEPGYALIAARRFDMEFLIRPGMHPAHGFVFRSFHQRRIAPTPFYVYFMEGGVLQIYEMV